MNEAAIFTGAMGLAFCLAWFMHTWFSVGYYIRKSFRAGNDE